MESDVRHCYACACVLEGQDREPIPVFDSGRMAGDILICLRCWMSLDSGQQFRLLPNGPNGRKPVPWKREGF